MGKRPSSGSDERGQVMLALLVAAVLVTVMSVSLVGLMNTDMTHASVQYAVSRSFYIAQAGLEEARARVFAAADPAADATPAAGVAASYGGGQFTYWVDAGPATGCGAGLKTLEALGQVQAGGRVIPTRIRACAVPGVPILTALFGVSRVEFQGVSRTYLAPYDVGTPGGGGNLGSFTEINFAGNDIRLNALSEDEIDLMPLRDGTFPDYRLFGFSSHPHYNPMPAEDPTPWILGAFGDLIKAKPATGLIPNPCGTRSACVTVGNRITDVSGVGDLREANYLRHVYVRRLREESVPLLSLDPALFQSHAEENSANGTLNRLAGLAGKSDSRYTLRDIYAIMTYMARHPGQYLQGPVYVDGLLLVVPQSIDLGGPSGNLTLAVGGDLIIYPERTLTITHDLSTVSGRRTPAVIVFGAPEPSSTPAPLCGKQYVTGSGRLVMCEGSTLIADGLVYTRDGMMMESRASVDQIGAMYHNNRNTPNPSFTTQDATVVLRFDPLALSAFGRGIAVLSWQELR